MFIFYYSRGGKPEDERRKQGRSPAGTAAAPESQATVLLLPRGRCARLVPPPLLAPPLPRGIDALLRRVASGRVEGCFRFREKRPRRRDGPGAAASGAELPRPRAALAAPRRAARQPRLPRAAAAAGDCSGAAPRGPAPAAHLVRVEGSERAGREGAAGCFSPGSPSPRREETSLDTEIKRFIAKKADLLFAHSWKPNGPLSDTIEENEGEPGHE